MDEFPCLPLVVMSYSTTINKLVDMIPALHQSDCLIPYQYTAKTVHNSQAAPPLQNDQRHLLTIGQQLFTFEIVSAPGNGKIWIYFC